MLEAGQIDPSPCHVKNKVCSRVKISPRDLFASCYFAGRPGFRRHRSERNDISMTYPELQQGLEDLPALPRSAGVHRTLGIRCIRPTPMTAPVFFFSLGSLGAPGRGPTLSNVGFGACTIGMCSSRNRVCMAGGGLANQVYEKSSITFFPDNI